MSSAEDFIFNLNPQKVRQIKTKYRRIRTSIPSEKSLEVLKKISKYESSNVKNQPPIVWTRSKDFQIWDDSGNCWIDLSSTIFVTNSGHTNKNIIKAINKVSKRLLHSYSYPTKERAAFLEKLIEVTPVNFEKASLYSSGTEATERVLKLIRLHGRRFSISKKIVIAWEGNYHGKTMGAQLLSGSEKDKEWIGYKDEGIVHLPFPFPWILDGSKLSGFELFQSHLKLLESKGVKLTDIAGFLAETFQGWGAIFYPKDYVEALRIWSTENNSLLAFDEIQAGFGRCGTFFGYEHYGIEPDLISCGKAISGSLPLSAVLGSSEIIDLDPTYTSTHGGHPVVCAAGLANLIEFERLNLVEESRNKGLIMKGILESWKDRFPKRIGMISGHGLLYAVFIMKENHNSPMDTDVNLCDRIVERCMQQGVFLIRTGRGTLKFGPPLTIKIDALREALRVVEEVLEDLLS
jgi:4-aminobutyrate aminotransferase / (S)-3-amino-2-methylpropionate transaminase / 5-aminovalerate transaminase